MGVVAEPSKRVANRAAAGKVCRQPIVAAIKLASVSLCDDLGIHTLGMGLDKLIIDCTSVCYVLHSRCFKKLGLVPKRNYEDRRIISRIHWSLFYET